LLRCSVALQRGCGQSRLLGSRCIGGDGGSCPLPGTKATPLWSSTAATGKARVGRELRFCCDCLGAESHWAWKGDTSVSDYDRHLGDAYEALITGRVLEHGDTLPAGKRAYWLNRLGHDIGLIAAGPSFPSFPADASDLEQRAREHFALFSARRRHETGSPGCRVGRGRGRKRTSGSLSGRRTSASGP